MSVTGSISIQLNESEDPASNNVLLEVTTNEGKKIGEIRYRDLIDPTIGPLAVRVVPKGWEDRNRCDQCGQIIS